MYDNIVIDNLFVEFITKDFGSILYVFPSHQLQVQVNKNRKTKPKTTTTKQKHEEK